MALESGVTYIEDLVSTNPVGATDDVAEGDDHIRNIKTAVQGSFPNLGADAVTKTAAEINNLVEDGDSGTALTSPVINTGVSGTAGVSMMKLGTTVATTSGSTADFTSIPTWAKKIVLSLNAVKTTGTLLMTLRLGDSGGIESTGYVSSSWALGYPSTSGQDKTDAFLLHNITATNEELTGQYTFCLVNSANNTWSISGFNQDTSGTTGYGMGTVGFKSLTTELDRISVITPDAYSSGEINIVYEG